jgi:hypothetical protein
MIFQSRKLPGLMIMKNRNRSTGLLLWKLLCALLLPSVCQAGNYSNFVVSVYCRAYEVRQMTNLVWLSNVWNTVGSQLKVDKVYLETHRDGVIPDRETIASAKRFFESRGIRVAAGIATVANERNLYQSFCYSTPADRKKLKDIVEYTAGQFDEIILDDFFFTNCKDDACVKAKGDKSWTQFRLEQMDEVARDLVVKPTKKINPRVKVVLKFPNWYEHYQGLGYNLEAGVKYFDGIYTGTETREPFNNAQHLQQYQGYLIVRYLENADPGRNGGGWVDTGGMRYADRYAEQLWLTLFAKAPEITLFDLRQIQRPMQPSDRGAWQDLHPSFDFDQMMASVRPDAGTSAAPATISRAAGFVFDRVDAFLGKLGQPVGLKSYKPVNSVGEDYVHNYLGMIGIPFELTPKFPTDAHTVFLAESAGADPDIVSKIKKQLMNGKNVIITSGLLRALQNRGIEGIAEIRYTDRKITLKEYLRGFGGVIEGKSEITIPELDYITNDAWALVSGTAGGIPYPLLLRAGYAKGCLYVLTLPENFGDIYNLPPEVLTQIKRALTRDVFVRVEGPAQVSLFAYGNNTFIVESFLPDETDVKVAVAGGFARLRNLVTGSVTTGEMEEQGSGRFGGGDPRTSFTAHLLPHSYSVFAAEK